MRNKLLFNLGALILCSLLLNNTISTNAEDTPEGWIGIGLSYKYLESDNIGKLYDSDGNDYSETFIIGASCDLYRDENEDSTYTQFIENKVIDGLTDPNSPSGAGGMGAYMDDIAFTNLETGDYVVSCDNIPNEFSKNYYEKYTPPTGWKIGDDYLYFANVTKNDISYSGMGAALTVNVATQDLDIKKVDADTNEPIPNTEFELYQDSNGDGTYDVLVDTYTTDSDGLISLDNIIYGDYQLVETKAADGYYNDNYTYSFTSDYNSTFNEYIYGDEDNPFIIENEKEHAYIELLKVGQFNEYETPLENVTFSVYADTNNNNIVDNDEQIVDTLITDEEGIATTTKLPLGNYIVIEDSAPDGVLVDSNTQYSINLTEANTTYYLNDGFKITNSLLDEDNDGIVDISDLCLDSQPDDIVDNNGCTIDESESNENQTGSNSVEVDDQDDLTTTIENGTSIADTGLNLYSSIIFILILVTSALLFVRNRLIK